MNTERLTTLANYLESVPEERFFMNQWASDPECRTAGCAIGHACQIPEFKKAGLELIRVSGYLIPAYGDFIDWGAVAAFFDITGNEAESMFLPSRYVRSKGRLIKPTEVVTRIRALVAS